MNSNRNKKEELAPALMGVEYIDPHCEKVASHIPIKPINLYQQGENKTFTNVFCDPVIPEKTSFKTHYMWKTNFEADSDSTYR